MSVEKFISYVDGLNEPAFEAQKGRLMTQSEKENTRDAKVAARSLLEVKNVIKSILKQSITYIRSDAYVIWRMAQIVNNDSNRDEFNAFEI